MFEAINAVTKNIGANSSDDEVRDAVRLCVMTGYKIEAIKAVRAHYGMGLKESKDLVDVIIQDLDAECVRWARIPNFDQFNTVWKKHTEGMQDKVIAGLRSKVLHLQRVTQDQEAEIDRLNDRLNEEIDRNVEASMNKAGYPGDSEVGEVRGGWIRMG